jgi:gluconokinase
MCHIGLVCSGSSMSRRSGGSQGRLIEQPARPGNDRAAGRGTSPDMLAGMIVLVGGVAGSGKTTVGALLASRLRWPFADADGFHPAANIAKMRSGVPLTDADRELWLAGITAWMDERIAAGESAVAGCSALKRRYRDQLLAGRAAWLAFLEITRELAHARLAARHGHFFTVKLMDSQFAELEPPQDEPRVIVLDAADPPDQLAGEIVQRLGLVAGPAAAPRRPDGPTRR